jgi:hypothetical protein
MPSPFALLNRQTFRAPTNPLDKATVVSIYPRAIDERKYTIEPGRFQIPAGSYDNPSVLAVGPSSWWKDIDENQPLLEIPISSITVAESVVRDYCNGLFMCDMGGAMPGLFYVQGEHKSDSIKKLFKPALDEAKAKQRNWYSALVKAADILWNRSQGNPLSISDDMRTAAQELGLNAKEWIKDYQSIDMVKCVACGALRNPNFPICGSCKAIVDTARAKELGLTFAS